MDDDEAWATVAEVDDGERADRARRLVELTDLIGTSDDMLFGQAAAWLIADVRATWIYGYFAATVVAADAYCRQHLAGLLRMHPADPAAPAAMATLDDLAAACVELGVIDVNLRAKVVELQASAAAYLDADLNTDSQRLERRLQEASQLNPDTHPLEAEARAAVQCCAALLAWRRGP